MSFATLITTLKGSSTSGNWGHAGIPGHWGGSKPGGGYGAVGGKANLSKSERAIVAKVRRSEHKPQEPVATKPDAATFDKVGREAEKDLVAHYNLKEFAKTNKAEAKALTNYSSWSGSANYYRINDALRKGKQPSKIVDKAVKDLDSAFEKSPKTPVDMQVYRVTRFKPDKDKDVLAQFTNLKPGSSFSDKAFVSTSLSPGITKNSFLRGDPTRETAVTFKINVPKGSKAIYMKDLSHTKTERELLLPRDQKFKVASNVTKKDGTIEITLDLD